MARRSTGAGPGLSAWFCVEAATRPSVAKRCEKNRDLTVAELVRVALSSGYDIRTVQELLGHSDVRTTMICPHVLNRGGRGVQSPMDKL